MRHRFARLLLAALALAASPVRANDLRIDSTRSCARFGVRLLWLHTISGRFTQIAGQVRLDPQGDATVDAHIATASLATESERTRRWMLAPEFFDAAHHPAIRFLSVPVPVSRLTSGGALDGQLSLRGVTRPVQFQLLPANCDSITARDCLIEVRGHVSRSAFGMTRFRATLYDRVQLGLVIALEPAPN